MTQPHTLKVEFEGDLRRFRLRLVDDDSCSCQIRAIHKAISAGFTLSEDEPPLVLKYKDDEGDLCTLVEATIEDFLAQAGGKPLRLLASRPVLGHTAAAPPAPAASTPASASSATSKKLRSCKPEAAVLCPRGHRLEEWASSRGVHWACDGKTSAGACKTVKVKDMKSFRCNACDYDLCHKCFEAMASAQKDASLIGLKQTPAASSTSCPRNAASDGCHSMGPWKLLMCLRSLHDADMMSCKMVGSMMLQFLPILSQRAHRKQEKLNKLGPQKREALLALLHSVSAHLELVEEARPVKPLLEEFITGADVSRLGDFVAALFKALATSKDRHAVSEAITGVAPELLESLPQLFPDLFGPTATSLPVTGGPLEHSGFRCSACSREPIKGPRFHCAEAKIDLCGECFIDQGCEVSDQQFQCFFTPPAVQGASNSFPSSSPKEDMKASWREWKEQLKGEWRRHKGKSKGKGKGKGAWHNWWWADPSEEASEEASNSTCEIPRVEASDAGDCGPPGLELAAHCWGAPWWHRWLGKGKGQGKSKDKNRDWGPKAPWGLWEEPVMFPTFAPQLWPWSWDAWQGDEKSRQFQHLGCEDVAMPTGSERREQGGSNAAAGIEQTGNTPLT